MIGSSPRFIRGMTGDGMGDGGGEAAGRKTGRRKAKRGGRNHARGNNEARGLGNGLSWVGARKGRKGKGSDEKREECFKGVGGMF